MLFRSMSQSDYDSLGKSKVLVTGEYVAREAAINALVKLYEIKTNSQIKNYPTLEQSGFLDIEEADPAYQTGLLKAVKIGLYTDNTGTDPKGMMNFGELMYMLDIIMLDAGM